jgi:hypothetical protein
MLRPPIYSRVACSLLLAYAAHPAYSDDDSPSGRRAQWEADHLMGENCSLSATAYGADGEASRLEFVWRRPGQFLLQRTFKSWQRGELQIASPGTADTWTVLLDSQFPALSSDDVEKLVRNVGRGLQIVLTATPKDGSARELKTGSSRAEVATAMFLACAKSLEEHPPPKDLWLDGAFTSSEVEDGCMMSRTYQIGHAALGIVIKVGADRSRVFVKPVPVLFLAPRQNGRQPDIRPQKSGIEISDKPYRVDAKDLYGPIVESGGPDGYDLTLEQLEVLEREIVAGGSRKLTLKVSGEGTRRETFGGPLAVAPAAMLAACRRAKFTAQPR